MVSIDLVQADSFLSCESLLWGEVVGQPASHKLLEQAIHVDEKRDCFLWPRIQNWPRMREQEGAISVEPFIICIEAVVMLVLDICGGPGVTAYHRLQAAAGLTEAFLRLWLAKVAAGDEVDGVGHDLIGGNVACQNVVADG